MRRRLSAGLFVRSLAIITRARVLWPTAIDLASSNNDSAEATPLVTPLPPMPPKPMAPAVIRMDMMAITTSISTSVKAWLCRRGSIFKSAECMGLVSGCGKMPAFIACRKWKCQYIAGTSTSGWPGICRPVGRRSRARRDRPCRGCPCGWRPSRAVPWRERDRRPARRGRPRAGGRI